MVRVAQKHKALSWVVLNCSVTVNFLSGWEGGDVDHLGDHPDVMLPMALWLTRSQVELFCNVVSRFEVFHLFKPRQ